jgi:hypothetical protein
MSTYIYKRRCYKKGNKENFENGTCTYKASGAVSECYYCEYWCHNYLQERKKKKLESLKKIET